MIPRRLISDGNNDLLPSAFDSNSGYILLNQLIFNKSDNNLASYNSVLNAATAPYNANRSHCSGRIKAYYQYVRGLRTKTSGFLLSSTSCDHDIIALTETSLHTSIFDGELFDTSEFLVHRCDRSMLNSDCVVLGGVLIAVRSHIKSELVTVPGIDDGNCKTTFRSN